MPLTDLARASLDELPRSPLLARAAVVDTFLDMLSATDDDTDRVLLQETLARLPRSVVVDRTAVADLLLDLLGPGEPSVN